MATVIDALVVELELDASEYKRNWKDVDAINTAADAKRDRVNKKNDKEERERARKSKQEALDRKKYTDDFTGSIAKLGATIAGAFLGFESLESAAKYLSNLNAGQAALGRTATQIGIGARELNIYGKAVELAGGKAEDAQATFSNLARQFSEFKIVGGTPGPLLQLLTQKGVAFRDSAGNLRDIGTILDELSRKTANMSDQDRTLLFARAGIAEGVINRMLEESKIQDEQLEKARQLNALTNASAQSAEKVETAWKGVGQAVERAGTGVNDFTADFRASLYDHITAFLSGGDVSDQSTRDLYAGSKSQDERARAAREKYLNYQLDQKQKAGDTGTDSELVAPKPGSLAARNNNPGNLEDGHGNFLKFATLAEGQAAMRADIEAKIRKGYETIASIITRYEGTDGKKDPKTLAAYIARASKLTGKGATDKLTASDLIPLLNAMTIVESALPDSAMKQRIPGATPGIVAGSGSSGGATSTPAAGNTTTVNVDKIEVNSTSADPAQVAGQTGAAIQRKISAAQANTGQQ